MTPRLLSIAGSDSGGGAGIQADIKTASAFDVYAATAITAVTAQNTQRVASVHAVPAEIVRAQIDCVLSDIGADAIKIGMLANVEICQIVLETLTPITHSLVLDPVMVSTSGDTLLDRSAVQIMRNGLMPLATLVTPNLPEFDLLFNLENPTDAHRLNVAQTHVAAKGNAILLKGGHGTGSLMTDHLVTPEGVESFQSKRIDTVHTHGTGCTLSAAVASLLARGETLSHAVSEAIRFVHNAIENAPGLGRGHGPLDFLSNNKTQQ
jgi:hydroxymethylpyrimidine/phosphomethylpyrimidine kinase